MKNNKIGFIILGHEDYDTGIDNMGIINAEKCIEYLNERGFEVIKYKNIIKDRDEALKASIYLNKKDISGYILYASSMGVAHPSLVILKELKHIPVCLYGIYGKKSGTMTASIQLILILKGILQKMDYDFKFVYGQAYEKENYNEIFVFAKAATTIKRLIRSRIGIIGNGYSFDMLSESTDILNLIKVFGTEFLHLDTYDLIKTSEQFKEKELSPVLGKLNEIYKSDYKLKDTHIENVCRFYLALKKIKDDYGLDAINVKCYPELGKSFKFTPCIPMSMLTSIDGTTMACEGALLVIITMLIYKYISGSNSIYGDIFENVHTDENYFGLNTCGYVPFDLYDKETGIKVLEWEHPEAEGLLNSCVFKKGKLVFGRLQEKSGQLQFLFGRGEGINTKPFWGFIPALNIKIEGDMNELVTKIIGHHLAITWENVIDEIEEFCRILKIQKMEI